MKTMNHRKREQTRLARRMQARRERIYQAWIVRCIVRMSNVIKHIKEPENLDQLALEIARKGV